MADSNRSRLLFSSIIRTVLPIAIPMLILSLLISRMVGAGITNEIDSGNISRLDQYTDYFDDQFSSLEHMEAILSSSPTIRFRLRSIFRDNSPITYDKYLAMDTISDFLQSSIQYSSITDSIYVYFPNKEGWFFSSRGGMARLSSDRDTIWYDILRDLIDNDERGWSGFRSSSWLEDEEMFSIIHPIDTSGDWNEGALILNADPEAISRLLTGLMEGETGNLIILGEDESPLFSTAPYNSVSQYIHSDDSGSPVTVLDDDVVYSEEMEKTGWKALLVIPKREAYRLNYATDLLIGGLTIIVIIISVFIAVIRTKDELSMFSMLQKELEGNPAKKGKRSYLRLSKELFSSYLKAKRLNDERIELELTALSLQLTPHFLFNTLQVIRWKTVGLTGNENDASIMIGDLSALLGYVLGDRNIFSSLEDEINAAKAYIAIQERRFAGEFDTIWEIAEEADGEIRIPKLILQPIIENAISHGLRGSGKKGILRIEIFIHLGRMLKVRIIDNGKGMDRTKLRNIRRALAKRKKDGPISIGLGNIQTRLSLLFSPSRTLSVQSREGKGTCVTFSIPLDPAEIRKI